MDKKKKEKIITYVLLFILAIISIYLVFLFKRIKYNYEHITGAYFAQDESYLVLNSDKTFYWYIDKNKEDDYYFGKYSVYRGENAVEYITKDLALFGISEEQQRQTIENIDIKNAIDHYYLIILSNEKVVADGKENRIFKDTRYYGFATEDYNEFDLLNIDADNFAVFVREEEK